MDRRLFVLGATAATLAPKTILPAAGRDPVTVRVGEVQLNTPWARWTVTARDITIDGITFPKFEASWLAANLAAGVASAVGGFLFNLFISAIGLGNPSMEELLLRQLERIQNIVEAEIRQNEIRRAIARLESIRQKMIEYLNVPSSVDRLQNATADSTDVFAELKSFGFQTYFQTLSAGSIHLAVLQERFKRDRREQANYKVVVDSIVEYHDQIAKQIDRETNSDGRTTVDRPILGYPVRDIDKIQRDSPEMRNFVIEEYNARLRLSGSPLLRPVPAGFNPPRTTIPYDIALWGLSYNVVADQISVPRDSIAAKFINWPKFRMRVREKTILPGDKIIAKLKDSTPHLSRLR